ncbi:MAG: M12 family metallo-peptidase, partial [Saprospiraceae bacterium]|nr:M12 family metallo-peptidase [Saprospiraceae bacterium]
MNSRLLITFIWSLFATLCTSQTPISNSVEDARNNYRLEHIELFQMIEPMSKPEIPSGVERFGLYDISRSQLGSIMEQKKPFISVKLQLETQNYTLELLEIELLDKDFRVVNAQEEEVDLPRGKHYRGIVNGDPNSMAAVSFFNDEVIGVLILPSEGVFNLGKLENDNEHYVFYPEGAIETQNPFVCGNDESMDVHYEDESPLPVTTGAPCKKVNVYIEADNIMYRDFSSNMTAVTNFITAVWNVSALIYQNEDIILGIKTIKIWNTPDPYRKNEPKNLLDDFSSNVKNNIDGDIGHILTTTNGRLGGLAWVDVLCKSYRSFNNYNRTAMSNINRSYRQFPVYSWTVMVVTHEMGHNLGSHHTHRCVWGPQRNEALDNCEDTEGNCPPGPAPIGGGTIMSYCHLTQYGINFSKGFGDEPGNRIRSRIDNAICLGSAFQTSVDIEGEVQFYEGDSTILKANPVGPQYTYQWYKDDLILPDEDNSEIIVKNSGTYYCEITTSCSEVTEEVTVEVEPFYVSLHCPLQDPVIGSSSYTLDTIFIDAEEDIHLIDIPASLANSVPDDVESSSINMEVCVSSYPPSRVLDLNLNYSGPAGSNIEDIEFTEHQNIFYGQECFLLHLGSFDPTGEWTFRVSHSFTDRPNLPESWAAITIFQNWEFAPEPSDCDLNLCEGDTAVLDA